MPPQQDSSLERVKDVLMSDKLRRGIESEALGRHRLVSVRGETLDFLWNQFEGRGSIERRLDEALRYIDVLLAEKRRIESRRAVRVATAAARLARPLFRAVRAFRSPAPVNRLRKRSAPDIASDLAQVLEQAEGAAAAGDLETADFLWRHVADTEHRKFASIARVALFLTRESEPVTSGRTVQTWSGGKSESLIVYSAILGDEDVAWVPGVLPTGTRVVVFADGPVDVPPGTEVLRPPYLGESPRKTARWLKTHPHVLFPQARCVLWMDANLTAVRSLDEMLAGFRASGAPAGFIRHPDRSTVEEEVAKCLEVGKAPDAELIGYLRRRHLQARGPLFETNVVAYDVAHPGLPALLSSWWSEIDGGTIRDQVSLPFVLGTAHAPPHLLLPHGDGARGDLRFGYSPHGSSLSSTLGRASGHLARAAAEASMVGYQAQWIASRAPKASLDVVIPVHNALAHLERCVRSVLPALDDPDVRLIVSDDGSDPETAGWIRALAASDGRVTIQRSEHPTGFATAANRGIGDGRGELVTLLNSDTELPQGWLERVRHHFLARELALLSPLSNAAESQSVPERYPDNPETNRAGSPVNSLPPVFDVDGFDGLIRDTFSERLLFSPTVHGFCLAIRRTAFESVGGFDAEAFPRGFGEEVDLAFRLSDAGWLSAIALDLFVWHAKSASFNPEERRALDASGAAVLRQRYGGRLDAAVRALHYSAELEHVRATISASLPR